jgi:hypothetical protein
VEVVFADAWNKTTRIYESIYIHLILGLQLFPRESKDKDMAAMLEDITKEANDKSFVTVFQHGGI